MACRRRRLSEPACLPGQAPPCHARRRVLGQRPHPRSSWAALDASVRARSDRDRPGSGGKRAPNSETQIVVPVVGGVPVAVRGAEVPRVAVPGTAAQDPATRGRSGFGGRQCRIEPAAPEDRMAQTPRIRVFGMGDPGAHAGLDIARRHRAGAPAVAQAAQPVAEAGHLVLGQAAMASGVQLEAEKRGGSPGRRNHGLARMQPQPPALQVAPDAAAVGFFRLPRIARYAERRSASKLAISAKRLSCRLHISRLQPAAHLPADLIHGARRKLVATFVEQLHLDADPHEVAQLLQRHIRLRQVSATLARIIGLDERLKHLLRKRLNTLAEDELLVSWETIDGRKKPEKEPCGRSRPCRGRAPGSPRSPSLPSAAAMSEASFLGLSSLDVN